MSGPVNPFGGAFPSLGRPESCCGAYLRLTRDEARDFERRGTKLSSPLSPDGTYRDYRVLCDSEAETRKLVENHPDPKKQPHVRDIRYGLCSSCSSAESWLRRKRTELAKKADQERPR